MRDVADRLRPMTPVEQAQAAGRLLADRRMRVEIIGEARDGLGEPAWDMGGAYAGATP